MRENSKGDLVRFFLLFLICVFGLGEEISMKYGVSFGVFGEFGTVDTKLIIEKNRYKIKLNAYTSGIAKSLSGNRREFYESSGEVRSSGVLVPDIYTHEVLRDKGKKVQKESKIYKFDHKNRVVKFIKQKSKDSVIYHSEDENLSYYAQNDLLSLFFNFAKLNHGRTNFSLIAAGANKNNGVLDIIIPQDKEKIKVKNALGTEFDPYIIFINQEIFGSKRGELYLSLDERGYANKAILRDVLLFGDIVATPME